MSDLGTLLKDAASHLELLMLVKYASVGSLTLVILDIVETFSDEVMLMWPSKLTIMKAIYFANRYMPIVDIALGAATLQTYSLRACAGLWTTLLILYALGSVLSEVILVVRTLALWNFNRVVLGLLTFLTLLIVVPYIILVQGYLRHLQYPPQEVLDMTGCVASISDGVSLWFYASILLSETTVVVLTVMKRYTMKVRDQSLPLLFHTMYRDGTGFYAILLSVSIGNMLCMTLAPVEASSMLQLFHRAVHSTLTSRVLLNLRAAAARSSGLSMNDFHRSTHIAFEVPAVHSTQPDIALSDLESESSEY
ncbi:hypothetical protein C8Q73DRAFT_427279 [Cubamyces lactineus]|nr:hypothetical protein C8Q73DRAFT_427279 [Cubamyces lactineus]